MLEQHDDVGTKVVCDGRWIADFVIRGGRKELQNDAAHCDFCVQSVSPYGRRTILLLATLLI